MKVLELTFDTQVELMKLSDKIMDILMESEGPFIQIDYKKGPASTYRIEFHDFQDEHVTRLDMKYFAPWKSLTIQNVLLENRRQGTMTRILNLIKEQAKQAQIDKIIIESVLSVEMSACALKNGFEIDLSSGSYIDVGSFFDDTVSKQTIFAGNYVYHIKG